MNVVVGIILCVSTHHYTRFQKGLGLVLVAALLLQRPSNTFHCHPSLLQAGGGGGMVINFHLAVSIRFRMQIQVLSASPLLTTRSYHKAAAFTTSLVRHVLMRQLTYNAAS